MRVDKWHVLFVGTSWSFTSRELAVESGLDAFEVTRRAKSLIPTHLNPEDVVAIHMTRIAINVEGP